jgi:hypothetical protein
VSEVRYRPGKVKKAIDLEIIAKIQRLVNAKGIAKVVRAIFEAGHQSQAVSRKNVEIIQPRSWQEIGQSSLIRSNS